MNTAHSEDAKNCKSKLSGIFPSITTPFRSGEVNYRQLAFNIQKYNEMSFGGYMILGGNGEYLGLTEKETRKVIKTIVKNKKMGRTIVAGAGRESAQATIAFIKSIAEWPIDFVSIITPFYYAKNIGEANLEAYFLKIADESPLPLMIYNSPDYAAGLEISPKTVSILCRHGNIVGMKNSSRRELSEYIDAAQGETFVFHSGKAARCYPDLCSGAIGATLSMAIFYPEICIRLYELFLRGETAQAERLHSEIVRFSRAGLSSLGVPGVKYAMELRGFAGGEARLPLMPLDDRQKALIRTIMQMELNSDEDFNRL